MGSVEAPGTKSLHASRPCGASAPTGYARAAHASGPGLAEHVRGEVVGTATRRLGLRGQPLHHRSMALAAAGGSRPTVRKQEGEGHPHLGDGHRGRCRPDIAGARPRCCEKSMAHGGLDRGGGGRVGLASVAKRSTLCDPLARRSVPALRGDDGLRRRPCAGGSARRSPDSRPPVTSGA